MAVKGGRIDFLVWVQVRAIKKLKALGNGFDIVLVGKQQYVRSVPGELNLDGNAIISLAQASLGACRLSRVVTY